MNKAISISLPIALLIVLGCTPGPNVDEQHRNTQDTTEIVHYNINIVPDLSNRLSQTIYPKPLADHSIAKVVLENLYPRILTHRRSENQKDKLSVAFINKAAITNFAVQPSLLRIDLSRFDNQLKRIDYIKGRANETFQQDTARFISEFKRITSVASSKPVGADIWSFLRSGIDDILVNKNKDILSFQKQVYRNSFRNILILLTDGYIEAGIYGNTGCSDQQNQCYFLSKRRVDEFRRAFKASGESNMHAFFKEHNYGIVKVDNPNLAHVEVLALEFYDRSLTASGTPTVYPSDWEILKLFWSDWLEKSGVKRYEIRPIATSQQEVEEAILKFIGIN